MSHRYDLDHIRREADLKHIVSYYGVELEKIGDRWWAKCPFHDDGTPSFTVRICEDKTWRAGCLACGDGEGDCFDFIMRKESCTLERAAELVMDICGITPERKTKPGRVIATYDYRRNAEIIFQVQRQKVVYEDTGEEVPGKKAFRQRSPDGSGGWAYTVKGIEKPLYRQDEFQADPTADVWVVEGEKDVETLRSVGLVATTNAGGARAHWEPQYTEALRGRNVVICPDTDEPGRERGATIAALLHSTASNIFFVHLPAGKDVTEYLEAGASLQSLLDLITPWTPPCVSAFCAGQEHGAASASASASASAAGSRQKRSRVAVEDEPQDWRSRLIYKPGTANAKPLFANALTAFRHAPEWCCNGTPILYYNEFSQQIILRGRAPWDIQDYHHDRTWGDYEDFRACEWIQRQGIELQPAAVSSAVMTVSREQVFHPVREYLRFLSWDKTLRLPMFLHRYAGATDNAYHSAVGLKWMISAVARILNPGCKADCCLILEGKQGRGKSTFFRYLADPWFTDEMSELGGREAAIQTAGVWVVELAELASMSRAHVNAIKSFLSRSTDRFRRPWGHHAEEFPRQCVFAGTTNKDSYLADETGDRRFWPVQCGPLDLHGVKQDRDQLWAEAVQRYQDGETWYLDDPDLIDEAEIQQQFRYEGDAWEDLIMGWVSSPERRRDQQGSPMGTIRSIEGRVSIGDILYHALEKPIDRWTRADEIRVQRVLVKEGFRRQRLTDSDGKRTYYYVR